MWDVRKNVKALTLILFSIALVSGGCNESGVGGAGGGSGGGGSGGSAVSLFNSGGSSEPTVAINQANDALNNEGNAYAIDQADLDLLESENLLDESDPENLKPFVKE